MAYSENRRCTLFYGKVFYGKASLLLFGFAIATTIQADLLSTKDLKQQCQPLMEGSQSLMTAFQSGQCSSYILGIYDLVAQQCPSLKLRRERVVRSTLAHLSSLRDDQMPAVQAIDQFLTRNSRCLPVAGL
ncbi:hypothetical protein [Oceanospirillum maris]|uniref:hypothetical protein n=1 Tax=Oceanospirillum maris TaxID=64977 RepID=UPI000414272F|nr:hypothetical protein [Oceanospirillum maris]